MTTITQFTKKLPMLAMAVLVPVLLSACSSQPTKPEQTITKPSYKPSIDDILRSAATLPLGERAKVVLAITKEMLTSDPQRAKQILQQLPYASLPTIYQAQYALQQAMIAYIEKRYDIAANWLDRESLQNAPKNLKGAAHILRAQTCTRRNNNDAALNEWLQAFATMNQQTLALYSQEFWQTLLKTAPDRLAALNQQITKRPLKGWLELATVYTTSQSLTNKMQDIAMWRAKWHNHPAMQFLPEDIANLQDAYDIPEDIAVLLPLTGRLAPAGLAVQQGILSGYYTSRLAPSANAASALNGGINANALPMPVSIKFYNTDNADINSLAQQAIDEGADFVIGPLDKTKVNSLSNNILQQVPFLVLNSIEDKQQLENLNHLYQFSLGNEEEAEQVAHQALTDGHRNAVVITPETDRGRKIRDSFLAVWKDGDGIVVDAGEFSDKTQFSTLTGNLLQTNRSEKRIQAMERLLKTPINGLVRRRQDVDMIFAAVTAKEARQLKPALDYQFASDIPFYTIEGAYSGVDNPKLNQDLDGMRTLVMPWLVAGSHSAVEAKVNQLWPQSGGQFGSLYALGLDAYELYPFLQQLKQLTGTQLEGNTGLLNVEPNGRVRRTLLWRVFRNGRLQALPTTSKGQLDISLL